MVFERNRQTVTNPTTSTFSRCAGLKFNANAMPHTNKNKSYMRHRTETYKLFSESGMKRNHYTTLADAALIVLNVFHESKNLLYSMVPQHNFLGQYQRRYQRR